MVATPITFKEWLGLTLLFSGHQVMLWDCKTVPAFDMFDTFEPDVFLGQAYNLDEALIKCIYERPHLKIALRAGDWGDQEKEVDKSKHNILFCSKKEKELLKKLKDETGNQTLYIFITAMPTLKELITILRQSESSRFR